MLRFILSFILSLIFTVPLFAQTLITKEEAVSLALKNRQNLQAAGLSVQQQQLLLKGSGALDNPQLQFQLSPYDEGAQAGIQQNFSLPSVYRNRKLLQAEKIRYAQLQLQGSEYNLKREVRLVYLQLQYLQEKINLATYQDSIYNVIRQTAQRFFAAGQINKLEELQASSQADVVRNELLRVQADFEAAYKIFSFFTAYTMPLKVTGNETYVFTGSTDSSFNNIQLQLLQQEIVISEKERAVAKNSLLPELQAGVLFPTINNYQRPIGYQFGLTIPIWRKLGRSQVAAAEKGIEITKAQQQLETQRLQAQYRQAMVNYTKEVQSLNYFTTTALPQAREIVDVSQRLFSGGQLNYIESLRNLQTAFDIFNNHLETYRAYNEAVINLSYINGTL